MSHDDLDPGLPADEREQVERLAARLVAERPVPTAAFRGELRRRVGGGAAPAHTLRLRVAAYLTSGVVLLAVAALGVSDVGPLAPSPSDGREAVTQVSSR